MYRSAAMLVILAIGLLTPLAPSTAVFAQEATPAPAEALALPLAPDPATRCNVEPRPLAAVRAAWEEVNAAPSTATPAADPVPFDAPQGELADEQIVQEITAVIVEVIACAANGGSGLHDAALVTDRHLRDSNNLLGMPLEDFEAFYTENPEPSPPEHWLMVYAVHDVIVLSDGRVGARPEVIVPGDGHYRDDYLIFAKVDGRWLIDFSYYGPNSYPAA